MDSPLAAHGRRCDIGGYSLFMHKAGIGAPTVVLESGWGDGGWLDWMPILSDIARFTSVIAYDRAGLGWSDPSPFPRTRVRLAMELHELLSAAHVPLPYVLVGHSLGGRIVREYARRWPDQVAGMALLDSGHERFRSSLPADLRDWMTRQDEQLLEGLREQLEMSQEEIVEAEKKATPPLIAELLTPRVMELRFSRLKKSVTQAQIEEYQFVIDDDGDGNDSNGFMPHPVWVLSRGRTDLPGEFSPEHANAMQGLAVSLQHEFVEASPEGIHLVVLDSGHYIHWYRPQVVIAVIRQLVARSRGE
jgi:pimeloyl-ACP methyl ester carboxylesterase